MLAPSRCGTATHFSLKHLFHISIMSGPLTHFSPYRLLHSTRTVESRLFFSKSLINRTHALTFMYIIYRMDKKLIRYTVACVNEFAANKSLTEKQAFDYLCNHGAMDFLVEFYDVEHTLSFEVSRPS